MVASAPQQPRNTWWACLDIERIAAMKNVLSPISVAPTITSAWRKACKKCPSWGSERKCNTVEVVDPLVLEDEDDAALPVAAATPGVLAAEAAMMDGGGVSRSADSMRSSQRQSSFSKKYEQKNQDVQVSSAFPMFLRQGTLSEGSSSFCACAATATTMPSDGASGHGHIDVNLILHKSDSQKSRNFRSSSCPVSAGDHVSKIK